MTGLPCAVCGTVTENSANYCGWDCVIAEAKAAGGRVHTPNNDAIRCIKGDYTMLEHEHGDHPDYKYVVWIEYTGEDPETYFGWSTAEGFVPATEQEIEASRKVPVALIYTDGCIAVTLYECCYDMWLVRTGKHDGGYSGHKDWVLTAESLQRLQG